MLTNCKPIKLINAEPVKEQIVHEINSRLQDLMISLTNTDEPESTITERACFKLQDLKLIWQTFFNDVKEDIKHEVTEIAKEAAKNVIDEAANTVERSAPTEDLFKTLNIDFKNSIDKMIEKATKSDIRDLRAAVQALIDELDTTFYDKADKSDLKNTNAVLDKQSNIIKTTNDRLTVVESDLKQTAPLELCNELSNRLQEYAPLDALKITAGELEASLAGVRELVESKVSAGELEASLAGVRELVESKVSAGEVCEFKTGITAALTEITNVKIRLDEIEKKMNEPAEPTERSINTVEEPQLPNCDVRMMDYIDHGTVERAIKIGPDVNKIELDKGTIEVDPDYGLQCNGYCIANTIEDHEILVRVDKKSSIHGEELRGRYVEIAKFDIEAVPTPLSVISGTEINSKIVGIVTRVIQSGSEIVWKHNVYQISHEEEYAIITRSGFAPVRIPDGSKVRVGDVLVPGSGGLYTSTITADRRTFVMNNGIPRAKVLAALQDNLISALII